jgi:hypothetical protein
MDITVMDHYQCHLIIPMNHDVDLGYGSVTTADAKKIVNYPILLGLRQITFSMIYLNFQSIQIPTKIE